MLRFATTGYTAYDYAIGWGNGQWSALGRVRFVNYGGLPPSTPRF